MMTPLYLHFLTICLDICILYMKLITINRGIKVTSFSIRISVAISMLSNIAIAIGATSMIQYNLNIVNNQTFQGIYFIFYLQKV